MVTTESSSAVVVRIPVPAAVLRLRRRWDLTAPMGVPPHVTVLFPFLPPADLTPDVRRRLAAIARAHEPFDVAFRRVGRFPTVVYLDPDPPEPFEALTAAVVASFPGFPPYGGVFDVVVPHLTVTESVAADTPFDTIAAEAGRSLPFARRVATIEVLVESTEDRWHPHWRLPLGVRP